MPKLSAITAAASTLDGTELVYVVQGGASKKATASQFLIPANIGVSVQGWDADLDALAALSGTNTIYYRSGSGTWSAVTIGSNLTFSGGTLSASGTAGALLVANNLSDVANAATARDNLAAEPKGALYGINTQTGSSYTLVLTDAGKVIETNNASANTLTVPPNSSVAFPTNTRVDLVQYGAGQTTIAAGSGVTIRSSGGKLKLTGQYSGATLYKRGTDEWVLIGDITT